MENILSVITILAISWHIGVIGLYKFLEPRRRKESVSKLLKIIEIDLLESLSEIKEEIQTEKLEKSPCHQWIKEGEYQLRRIRKNGT